MKRAAYWLTPPLVMLVLYWPGLTCWFQKDDFAWLGLYQMIHGWGDVGNVYFHPYSQGTIRTLSERVPYTAFYALFGLNPLPFRILASLTTAAILVMLSLVCARLTGSRAAGLWAALLWIVNSAVAYPLSWTAIYYELLCSLFFLADLWLLLRYADTGNIRYYIAQCCTFVLGFGVLELNVVYPALALAYALCCAPRLVWKIVPLFLVSAVYTLIHTAVSPLPTSGPYQLFWDTRIFNTLWTYWKIALGPPRLIYLGIYPSLFRSALTVVLMLGVLGFLVCQLYKRRRVAAFLAAWFLIVLSPLLPLRNHMQDEYLTIPLLGLAMLAGWGVSSGRALGIALAVIYFCVAIPIARVNCVSFAVRSHKIQQLLCHVADVSRSQPGKTIVLRGLDSDMFWSGIYPRPFRYFGIDEVYVAAQDQPRIDPAKSASQFFIDPGKTGNPMMALDVESYR